MNKTKKKVNPTEAKRRRTFVGTPNRPQRATGQMSAKTSQKKRVFVAMSGGVDSSVTALLLKRQDYDVTGVFMRCYNVDGCAERDAEDARRVAEHIGIPFYVWDFEEEYKRAVVDYMIKDYKAGLTPNPDVMCNREIKFGLFLKRALKLGADFVATGHYVRLKVRNVKSAKNDKSRQAKRSNNSTIYTLHTARDPNKDQSYFLWTLTQDQLRHCLFPLGKMIKPDVRRIAKRAGLPTAEKKDSQGICFLGQVTLPDFLSEYLPVRQGAVVDLAGHKLGTHSGAHFYTIGQRQGIGNLKHQKGNRLHVPLYVVKKDVRRNTVTVAEGSDNPALFRKELELKDLNLISPRHSNILQNVGMSVLARVRYRQPLAKATLCVENGKGIKSVRAKRPNGLSGPAPLRARLVFAAPQKFVAEGQSAVFYRMNGPSSAKASAGKEMLGGGIIS